MSLELLPDKSRWPLNSSRISWIISYQNSGWKRNRQTCAWGKKFYFPQHFLSEEPKQEMAFFYQDCSDLLWEKVVLGFEKNFEIQGWKTRICKMFEITRTVHSNSEKLEQFFVTECFSNLFLEVSQI